MNFKDALEKVIDKPEVTVLLLPLFVLEFVIAIFILCVSSLIEEPIGENY